MITVQTDGAQNFDGPVPACFPNLPDPKTGQKLPPGGKSALWSFNHDTGQWEIRGSMTEPWSVPILVSASLLPVGMVPHRPLQEEEAKQMALRRSARQIHSAQAIDWNAQYGFNPLRTGIELGTGKNPYTLEEVSRAHAALDAYLDIGAPGLGRAVGLLVGKASESSLIRGLGNLLKDENGFTNLPQKAGNDLVTLFHHTSGEFGELINQSGVLKSSGARGLWMTGDVYLTTKSELSTLDRLICGLTKSKTEVVVRVSVPESQVATRPFGIRIVEGPINLDPPQMLR